VPYVKIDVILLLLGAFPSFYPDTLNFTLTWMIDSPPSQSLLLTLGKASLI
jgi:hypothetical protein